MRACLSCVCVCVCVGVGEEEVGRRRVRGGEKRERKDNGVFRGLVCVCVCVCVRALYFSLNVMTVF